MNSIIVVRRVPQLLNRTNCDTILLLCSRQSLHHDSSKYQKEITELFTKKYNLVNQYYERFIGIAEVRQIQTKVLDVEREFVDITKQRKACQDRIDDLKDSVKQLREKLETLSRSSDNYLNLITTEHKLLKDQISLEKELTDLKEREQLALDTFSALLRQSHEVERLRQDRSKYWQVITTGISFLCGAVAVIREKTNNQRNMKKFEDSLAQTNKNIEQNDNKLSTIVVNQQEDRNDIKEIKSDLRQIKTSIRQLKHADRDQLANNTSTKTARSHYTSWLSYIPGLTTAYGWIYGQS